MVIRKNLKKLFCMAALTSMMLSVSACGNDNSEVNENQFSNNSTVSNLTAELTADEVSGAELDDTFVCGVADFSLELFKNSILEDAKGGRNVLISPESAISALAMTANGAANDTLNQFETVMAGGIDIEDFNRYMLTYNQLLSDSSDVSFRNANSIWINNAELQVEEKFLQTDINYYNADIYRAAFDDTTVDDINEWVNFKTNGMIPNLLSRIPGDVVMYLINAIAFEGEWETEYTDSNILENGTFTNSDGAVEDVVMLNSEEGIYLQDDNASGFVKYYKGGDYAFLALLPDESIGLTDYISDMSGERFIALYNNRQYDKVNVTMPEFSYDYEKELSETLSEMGMDKAFTGQADFSNIAESDTLYITSVIHKTHIEVDRHGTKAAAVTGIELTKETAVLDLEEPKVVILDRPFIYAIINTETGLPVFIGAVNTVK